MFKKFKAHLIFKFGIVFSFIFKLFLKELLYYSITCKFDRTEEKKKSRI